MAATAAFVFLKRYNGYLSDLATAHPEVHSIVLEEKQKIDEEEKTKSKKNNNNQKEDGINEGPDRGLRSLLDSIHGERERDAIEWLYIAFKYYLNHKDIERNNNDNNNNNNNNNNSSPMDMRKLTCDYCLTIVTALFEWTKNKSDKQPCPVDSTLVSIIDR